MTEAELLRQAARSVLAKRSLSFFVEATSGYKLHPWQLILCDRLQKLKDQKGQRILIHAPPQVGKSQIVSKRLPLWIIGQNPLARVIIAAYNKTQAGTFVESNKLIASNEVAAKAFGIEWAKFSADDGGYTRQRHVLADAQPNLIGVGLDSGFVGKNADLLIIDDPYPNAEHARSEAYNRSVRSFWEETAEPRLMANPDANVVVMFHRYHDMDIAGYLKTRGEWEELMFPAIFRGNPHDPTGRQIGEVLSPFLDIDGLLKKEADDPKTFAGQFQGEPLADGERPINTDGITVLPVSKCPALVGWYRGWDTAYTSKTGSDHSATLRAAFDEHGNLHLRGFHKERVPLADITDWALQIAKLDPPKTFQAVEMHNAGYAVSDYLRRQPGLMPWVINQRVSGSEGKLRVRLIEFIHLCVPGGRVYVYQEGDYQKFLDECETFTGLVEGESDDLLAALAVILLAIKGQKSNHEEIRNIHLPIKKPSQLFARQP